jgi:hypothetical protein
MDFSKIKSEFRREIVREGTVFLDGQLKVATAADARSAGLAAMFIAAATALTAGVVISIFNASGAALPARLPMMFGGGVAALCFITAAFLCIIALRPVKFWLPGLAPKHWSDEIASGRDLDDCLGERAKNIQEQIEENTQVIENNAKFFRRGVWIGVSAPFIGLIVWGLTSVCKITAS